MGTLLTRTNFLGGEVLLSFFPHPLSLSLDSLILSHPFNLRPRLSFASPLPRKTFFFSLYKTMKQKICIQITSMSSNAILRISPSARISRFHREEPGSVSFTTTPSSIHTTNILKIPGFGNFFFFAALGNQKKRPF